MRALIISLLVVCGCLEPAVEDAVDPGVIYGDPNLTAAQLPHVEENPALAANVAQFPSEVVYAQAYASDRKLWYWRVPPPIADFIVPFYEIVDQSGERVVDKLIIDVIPGDTGYSPWWRLHTVKTTDLYAGQNIWSREAIDLGVQQGILEPPVPTKLVQTCPVVRQRTQVEVDPQGTKVGTTWAIYRGQRVSWLEFAASDIEVRENLRRMPLAPFYVLQRVNQNFPLVELDAEVDLNGDGRLVSSNNIFQTDLDEDGYTPLWYPIQVRTVPDFVSIDTATAGQELEFTRESDFIGPVYNTVISNRVVGDVEPMREELRNCPLQRTFGEL